MSTLDDLKPHYLTPEMGERLIEVAKKAVEVREAQKIYFKNRTQENVVKSKVLEKELDSLLESFDQGTLV